MAGKRRYLEEDHCEALIRWRDLHVKRHPELALLIHLPLGGYRNAREAARLKRMGVRAGVSDYLLPVKSYGPDPGPPEDGWPTSMVNSGLWLELKADKGEPTQAQLDWHKLMRKQGYVAMVRWGWIEAARAICDYLGITGSVRP